MGRALHLHHRLRDLALQRGAWRTMSWMTELMVAALLLFSALTMLSAGWEMTAQKMPAASAVPELGARRTGAQSG